MYVDIFNSLLTPQIKTSAKKNIYRVNLTCLPDFLSLEGGRQTINLCCQQKPNRFILISLRMLMSLKTKYNRVKTTIYRVITN